MSGNSIGFEEEIQLLEFQKRTLSGALVKTYPSTVYSPPYILRLKTIYLTLFTEHNDNVYSSYLPFC